MQLIFFLSDPMVFSSFIAELIITFIYFIDMFGLDSVVLFMYCF